MNEVDTGAVGTFTFPNFLNMMLRKVDEVNAEDEIRVSISPDCSPGSPRMARVSISPDSSP